MKRQWKTFILLFSLGFIGVLSLLATNFELPDWILNEIEKEFNPSFLKPFLLINPTIYLFIAVLIGSLIYQKVGFKLPYLAPFNHTDEPKPILVDLFKIGVPYGFGTGLLLGIIIQFSSHFLPHDFIAASKNFEMSLLTRFLYGEITEEILIRFGLMSLLVLLLSKLFKGFSNAVYIIAIILSSIVFALGHLPSLIFLDVEINLIIIMYILIGNCIAGLVFGWIYWKKNLETAMIAHIFAHVGMLSFALFFN